MVGGPQALGRDRQPVPKPGDPGPELRAGRSGVEAADRGLDRGLRPRLPPEPARRADLPELAQLVGEVKAHRIASVDHMPTAVSMAIGRLLREGVEQGMDRFAFTRAEEERAKLIDHIGGCERILKTPLPAAYSVEIRQFIFVFLVALPFGILMKVGLADARWSPCWSPSRSWRSTRSGSSSRTRSPSGGLNHLPLDQICQNLERNLMALLADFDGQGDGVADAGDGRSSAGNVASAHGHGPP